MPINGTKKHDTLIGTEYANIIFGDNGNDLIEGLEDNDSLYGENGQDTLLGGDGDDVLDGGNGKDFLSGGIGNDLIAGGNGKDEIYGDEGDDTIDGGNGNDLLTGGEGADTFTFDHSSGDDVITDFDALAGDKLKFGEGLSEEDMSITVEDGNTTISFEGASTSITLQGVEISTAPSFSQGFEVDTSGWLDVNDSWFGNVARVASGTNGITSSEGDFHAIFEDPTDETGPFTRFDMYRDNWDGEWKASADIYLDTNWGAGEGFDYSVAANGSDGAHQRDFIFHVTKDTSTGELLVGGSNNTNFDPIENLESGNHFQVTDSGWYTFEHHFYDNSGQLAVDLNLYDAAGTLLFTETRTSVADDIATEIGGNRYGWFTNIDVDGGIAVDNTTLMAATDVGTSWYDFA